MSKDSPIDERVKVPAAVKRASERSDAAYQAFMGQHSGEPPANGEGEGQEGQPGASAVQTNEQEPHGDKAREEADAHAAPAGDQGQEPAKAETPPATTEGNSQTRNWENDFKAMRGRYEREQQHVRELSKEISNLHNVIASLQSQFAQNPAPAQTPAELQGKRLITPEEEAEYGTEFIDLVGRRAQEIASQENAQLKAELETLKKQFSNLGGTLQRNHQAEMLAEMDSKQPRWRELNSDQNFLAWLALPDPYSGRIRHELLKEAFAQNNAGRVLHFFNGFLSDEAATSPAAQQPAQQTQAPKPPSQQKPTLDQFAAPGRATTAAAQSAPAEKPIITAKQITQFYADVAAGKYRGKEDEQKRLEKMIFDAQSEGRITR